MTMKISSLGIQEVTDSSLDPVKAIKENVDILKDYSEALTGRSPVTGKNLGTQGKVKAKASLAAEGLAALYDLMVELGVKARIESDFAYVIKEIEQKMPKHVGGVLVGVQLGKIPNGAGSYIVEYLGLSVLVSGKSVEDAKSNLRRGRGEVRLKYGLSNICSIEDANQLSGPQLKASTPGRNHNYHEKLSRKIIEYRSKNPKNEQLNIGGGVLSRAYIEERLFFVDQNALEKAKKKK